MDFVVRGCCSAWSSPNVQLLERALPGVLVWFVTVVGQLQHLTNHKSWTRDNSDRGTAGH